MTTLKNHSSPEIETVRHALNEWADLGCNAIQWLKNIKDGTSTADDALAEMKSNYERVITLSRAADAGLAPTLDLEIITFPRWWVQKCHDQLKNMGQFPSGPLGDWAFLFRDILSDALAKSGVAPTSPETETSALADKIDRVLTEYLNSTNSAIKECEARALREILWDNKAGIVAGLRKSGVAPTPGVKPLEWKAGKGQIDGQFVWSSGDPWVFWIVKNPGEKYIWCENFNIEGFCPASPVRGSFDTLEDAKGAAQDDYTKRILAALVQGPDTSTDRQVNEIAARSPEVPKATIQKLLEATDGLCSDCPPVGYETDRTRCLPCPRRAPASSPVHTREGE